MKNHDLDLFLNAGADLRLLKTVMSLCVETVGKIASKPELKQLYIAQDRISLLCDSLDEKMFAEHPEIGDEYASVFYGDVRTPSRSNVDSIVLNKVAVNALTLELLDLSEEPANE